MSLNAKKCKASKVSTGKRGKKKNSGKRIRLAGVPVDWAAGGPEATIKYLGRHLNSLSIFKRKGKALTSQVKIWRKKMFKSSLKPLQKLALWRDCIGQVS